MTDELPEPEPIDVSRVKVAAFDLFGTVLQFRDVVPRTERQAYGEHLERFKRGEWAPFRPPKSWENLQAFPDARPGLLRLIPRINPVVLSNCPAELAGVLAYRNRLPFGQVIQLAAARVFKPDPRAYLVLCDVLDVKPENVLMVSANPKFGDIQTARQVGMQSVLIRNDDGGPKTIVELAERLGY